MSKTSKILIAGSTLALVGAIGLTALTPAFAITDNDSSDLNSNVGAVANSELVQVTTTETLIFDVAQGGLVANVAADGTETALGGGNYSNLPANMQAQIDTQVDGYSHIRVKSNDPSGYNAYVMMCTASAATPFSAVPGCNGGQNLVSGSSATYIAPTTDNSATLTGALGANVGGFWGYRTSSTVSGGTAAAAPSGNYQTVPAFTANAPYGDNILTSTSAGVGIANLNYSVITNSTLEGGYAYNNYVIYTVVAN